MTALLLVSVALAGAANIALVAFVADRLSPKSSVSVTSGGEFAIGNDNAPASTAVKRVA